MTAQVIQDDLCGEASATSDFLNAEVYQAPAFVAALGVPIRKPWPPRTSSGRSLPAERAPGRG